MSDSIIRRAGLLIQHRRYDEAAETLLRTLSQDPNDTAALRMLGICQYSKDQPAPALETFRQAVAIDPEDADLRVWLARTLLELKRPDEAHRVLDDAQAMEPELAEVFSARSQVFFHQTKWAEAEEAAGHALALDSEDLTAQNILSHALLMQGKQTESEAHISARMSRDPENAHTHVAAGYAALRRGDHKDAGAHFLEALRLEPENEAARQGLLTSFRARSAFYRAFLSFSFRVAKLQEKYRQWLFLGAFVVYKLVVAALKPVSPALAMLVVIFYTLFVLWSYVAQGIGTLLILGDPMARLALKPREKWEGILVGGGSVTGLALILLSLALPSSGLGTPGIALAAMSIPWALCLGNDNAAGRKLYGAFALGASMGAFLVVAAFISGNEEVSGLGLLLAVLCASVPTFLALFGVKRG